MHECMYPTIRIMLLVFSSLSMLAALIMDLLSPVFEIFASGEFVLKFCAKSIGCFGVLLLLTVCA